MVFVLLSCGMESAEDYVAVDIGVDLYGVGGDRSFVLDLGA